MTAAPVGRRRRSAGDGRHAFSFTMPAGDWAEETLAACVAGSDFWLHSNLRRPAAAKLMNNSRRGLALLRPGLSVRSVGDDDIAIAAELIEAWRALSPGQSFRSENDVGRDRALPSSFARGPPEGRRCARPWTYLVTS